MPDIFDTHPNYDKNRAQWQQIRDQMDGEETVKDAGALYLPFPVSLPIQITESDEFKQQYGIYLQGAAYVNFTLQAVEDLVASVFSRDPIIDESFPEDLEYLDLPKTSKDLCSVLVAYGRGLLLVEYPVVEFPVSRSDEAEMEIAAYYSVYDPLEVINWRTARQGGVTKLTKVVIATRELNEENEFEDVYIEMSILEGIYTIQKYNEDGDPVGAPLIPKASGAPLNYIPATFVGVQSNDSKVDPSPVMGIANTSLKHYQNTAELQHVIHYIGHPMLSITGAPLGFVDAMNTPNEDGSTKRISVGASQAVVIEGESGKTELLQISSDVVHFKQLEQLEKSMAEQGYRIKTDQKSGVESAKSLTIRASGSTSKLSSIATQVENAIKDSMKFINDYMGTSVPDDFQFDLVKNYLQLEPDSQLLSTLDGFVNSGRIPDYILYDYMVEVELLDEDVDYDQLREDSEALDVGLEFNPQTGAPNENPENPIGGKPSGKEDDA